jgi:hypothetical protein
MLAGSCEDGNELLDFINCGEFPDYLPNINLAGKALIRGLRESVAK